MREGPAGGVRTLARDRVSVWKGGDEVGVSILVCFRGEEVYMFVVRNRSQMLKGRRREVLFQAPAPNPVHGDTG